MGVLVLNIHALFVYGTLRDPEVCLRLLGRMPTSSRAVLHGYARLKIRGERYPAMVPDETRNVDGLFLTGLSEAELAALDAYEDDEYERIAVVVETDTGRATAWAYAWAGRLERLETEV